MVVDFLIIDKPIIIEQIYSPQYLTVQVFTVQYSKIVSKVAISVLIAKDLMNAVGESVNYIREKRTQLVNCNSHMDGPRFDGELVFPIIFDSVEDIIQGVVLVTLKDVAFNNSDDGLNKFDNNNDDGGEGKSSDI